MELSGLGDGNGSGRKVLVVDDEPAIRRLVVPVLRDQGYDVLEAGDPFDALYLAEDHPGPLDLVLSDLEMPRLYGYALWLLMRAQHPEAKVLFMSGGMPPAIPPGEAFLPKPFTISELIETVEATFNHAPDAAPAGLA